MRSSTRATSVGSEAAWKEFGFFSGSSWVKVPVATSASVSSVHSSSEPVHQWTRSGVVIAATSSTKARMPACVVGADVLVVMATDPSQNLLVELSERVPRPCMRPITPSRCTFNEQPGPR